MHEKDSFLDPSKSQQGDSFTPKIHNLSEQRQQEPKTSSGHRQIEQETG